MQKQSFKSQTVQIKFCKGNQRVQLSLYILKLFIVSCQLFCNSCSFSLFHDLLQILFSCCSIIVDQLYTIFLRLRKTNKKCRNVTIKNEKKKSEARNIAASKKYRFLIFVTLDLVVLENCTRISNLDIKLPESVIITNRLNLV